jgi:hypothetical protein
MRTFQSFDFKMMGRLHCELPAERLVTNEQNPLKGKLKPPADIERFKKTLNLGKVVRFAIGVADSYRKMKNIVHHARLKNVFQKLIVINSPTGLDLKDPPRTEGMRVSVETHIKTLPLRPKSTGTTIFLSLDFPFSTRNPIFSRLGRSRARTVSLCWFFLVLESMASANSSKIATMRTPNSGGGDDLGKYTQLIMRDRSHRSLNSPNFPLYWHS